jgi:hypothetical protein
VNLITALRFKSLVASAGLLVPLIAVIAVIAVQAAGAATVVLSRASGSVGTPVTATYTAPGCGGVASTVAFSLDSIGGHQLGSTSLNLGSCSAVATFPISGSAGPHQIFGYVPNSGAPVASAPFTILAAPPGTPTPTAIPTPLPTPTPTPTPVPTPTPTATPAAQNSTGFLNGLLVPALIALIVLLIILIVVLLVLLRRNRSRGGPPASA